MLEHTITKSSQMWVICEMTYHFILWQLNVLRCSCLPLRLDLAVDPGRTRRHMPISSERREGGQRPAQFRNLKYDGELWEANAVAKILGKASPSKRILRIFACWWSHIGQALSLRLENDVLGEKVAELEARVARTHVLELPAAWQF